MAKFQAGNTGRPAGAQNKLNKTVRDTVLAAFNELQEDPKANIKAWGQKNPSLFYTIAAKLIPTEIQAKVTQMPNFYDFEPDPGSEPIQD